MHVFYGACHRQRGWIDSKVAVDFHPQRAAFVVTEQLLSVVVGAKLHNAALWAYCVVL